MFLGWTALGLGWYLTVKMRKPQIVANAGAWGEHGAAAKETVGG